MGSKPSNPKKIIKEGAIFDKMLARNGTPNRHFFSDKNITKCFTEMAPK
jgi:hypothetical protein